MNRSISNTQMVAGASSGTASGGVTQPRCHACVPAAKLSKSCNASGRLNR
jgi:hypothetical protein